MKTIIPAAPGYSVIFADIHAISDRLATDPNAAIGDHVGFQSVIAWGISETERVPITYCHVDLMADRYRTVVLEESDKDALEARRLKIAKEIFNEMKFGASE